MRSTYAHSVLALLVASSLGGCSLFYDPCGDLEARLCDDLGSDCATFRSEPSIRETVIPQRRRSAERQQCEMFGADENYGSYTLPFVRYLVQQRRDPTLRMPALPAPRPAGMSSGLGSWLYCALPFALIPALFFYAWYARRQLGVTAGGGPAPLGGAPLGGAPFGGAPFGGAPFGQSPAGPSPAGPSFGHPTPASPAAGAWDHVDSRAKAEELARTGALVLVDLVPRPPGVPATPENTIHVPPHAAARMSALAQEIAQLVQSGHSIHAIAEPQYRGASFVPTAVVVRFGDRTETVHVW